MNKNKIHYCLLSDDVETHSIRFNALRDKTGIKVYEEALPAILDLYSKYNIKATFFYAGEIARQIPDTIRMVVKEGHEVACHGLYHEVNKAFDVLGLKEQIQHLTKAKSLLEDISGKEVISFRAPALRVNKYTSEALYESGFKIDSSISPQRLDLFLSFGSANKFQRIFSPRKPYKTKSNNLAFRGDGEIIEVPLSGLILPLVGSTMRVFPYLNSILQHLLLWESKSRNIPVVTYLHPTEFIDESNEPFDKITKRSKNYLKYVFADVIRHKLKNKNLGPIALSLYEKQIEFFSNHNYSFITMSDYCKRNGLLD